MDELGGFHEAVSYIEQTEGIEAELAEYRFTKTLAEILAGVFGDQSYYVGQGIGKAFLDAEVVRGIDVRT
jgi:hypothetical protein